MLAFHNDAQIKQQAVARAIDDRRQDRFVKGRWLERSEDQSDVRGCHIGGLSRYYMNPDKAMSDDVVLDHWRFRAIERGLGLPVSWLNMFERLYENMPLAKAATLSESLLEAIPVGADLEAAWNRFIGALNRFLMQEVPTDADRYRYFAESTRNFRDLLFEGFSEIQWAVLKARELSKSDDPGDRYEQFEALEDVAHSTEKFVANLADCEAMRRGPEESLERDNWAVEYKQAVWQQIAELLFHTLQAAPVPGEAAATEETHDLRLPAIQAEPPQLDIREVLSGPPHAGELLAGVIEHMNQE